MKSRFCHFLAGGFSTACAVGILAACKGATSSDNVSKPAAATRDSDVAVSWMRPVDVATGKAHAGPWQMNDSNFDYVDDPTVAIREDGTVGVAWCDNAKKDVFFQRFGVEGRPVLPAPVNVSQSPAIFSWLPRMVMAGEQVFLLWQEIVFSGGSHGGEIFFSRSRDGGRAFSAPINLSRSQGGDGKGRQSRDHWDNGSLDLVRGVDGKLFAAWTEYDGALWFSRSLDDGESFSTPVVIPESNEPAARGPSLAATRQAVYVAWAAGEEKSANLRLAISRDAGATFEPARVVFDGTARSDAPKLAVDPQGVLHLAYAEEDAGASQVYYARSKDKDGTFEAPRCLSCKQERQAASFPSLSLGTDRQVYVLWQHHPSVTEASRGLALSLSDDGGHHFTSPALVPSTADPALGINGSRQGRLMRLVASNARGILAVVNSSFREGENSRIRLIVGRVAARRWTTPE
jgi:hypothetical protein